jgi:hypothetical protein
LNSPVEQLRRVLQGNTIRFFGQDINKEVQQYTGYVELEAPGNTDIDLGSGITMATIVHELGHAFDRVFKRIPGDLLTGGSTGLRYSRTEGRIVFPGEVSVPGDAVPLLSSDGMRSRANRSPAASEVWADMFMTWVLNGITTPTTRGENSQSPAWDCDSGSQNASALANVRYLYTNNIIRILLTQGNISNMDQFHRVIGRFAINSNIGPCQVS